jgi:hypothetical protein
MLALASSPEESAVQDELLGTLEVVPSLVEL